MPKKGLASEFRHRREQAGIQNIEEKTVATISLFGLRDMVAGDRQSVAVWLRKQAEFVESSGDRVANTYTARYCAR